MIKLQNSLLTDILPEQLAADREVQALAYAVGRQVEALCQAADKTIVWAALAEASDKVLDLLAAELRTPCYDEILSPKIKRELIRSTLSAYAQTGTPAAVERMINTIFGRGYIKEWWQYGGQPYHFKAFTTNPAVTEDNLAEFAAVLASVKRLSAWLDEVVLELTTPPLELYAAHWLHTGDFIRLGRAIM